MFSLRRKQDESSVLDPVINKTIERMKDSFAEEDDFAKMASNLVVLMEAKAKEPKRQKISPDTIAGIIGGTLQIAMIVIFENRGNVFTSRSLPFVRRPKS